MRHKSLFDRLFILALALILVGGIMAMQQMGLQSGESSASDGSLAADAATQAGTGYISVPAASFQPYPNGYDYVNDGMQIYMNAGSGYFVAPLQLPHGATVTKITFYFYDEDPILDNYVFIVLFRNIFYYSDQLVSIVSTDVGLDSVSETTISYSIIDNSQYSYFITLYLGSNSVIFYNAFIEFTYPVTFLPLIMRDH